MEETLTIAMCTYQRDAAFEALASLKELTGLDPEKTSILVIDNDVSDDLRSKFEEFASQLPFALTYIHAPAKNISVARNAALDNCSGEWLAFIDDDELATPEWASTLCANRAGHSAIVGQVKAVFDPDMPHWLRACDFHSNTITDDVSNAYTSNVLLNMQFVRSNGLRFDESLGLTGGEDTLFFKQIVRLGGKMTYVPQALLFEPVPQSRASMKWVLRRKFRSGQTHALVTLRFEPTKRLPLLLSALAKAGFSLAASILTLPPSSRARKWFARACMHLGVASYCTRPRVLEEYS